MRLGLEHEYQLTDRDGSLVDYRTIIDRGVAHGWRVDPVDPLARRVGGGGLVTADGIEAELATPPVVCGPTALRELEQHVAAGVAHISSSLPPGVAMHGFSTHVNVECRRREVVAAERAVREWSPLLLAFSQFASSPGLLVRPRWRRLEFGADHLTGGALRSALVVAAAVTAAVVAGERLPRVGWSAEPSTQRFGWYVDRAAVMGEGPSREAVVPRGGTKRTMQEVLDEAWAIARAYAVRWAMPADVRAVDDAISGAAPLTLECEPEPSTPSHVPIGHVVPPLSRSVRGLEVWPHEISWRTAVFTVASPDGLHWVSVDGLELPSFLAALHSGRIDATLRAGCRSARRTLAGAGR